MAKSKSLQRQLTTNLMLIIVVFYLFVAGFSFYFTYQEAEEFQDDVLKQIAHYSGDTSNIPTSSELLKLTDEESAIFVFHLPHDTLPKWLRVPLVLGFQDVPSPHGDMRVFVNDDAEGRDVVAQLKQVRNEIAATSGLRSLLPLLFLLPLAALFIAWVVRKEFNFINDRAEELDQQTSSNLKKISLEGLPSEIMPFFAATNRLIERIKVLITYKRRLIADASHELRTPITALALQVDNLSGIRDLKEIENRLIPLKETVARTRELADQLLAFSKYEIQQPVMKIENLNSLLTDAINGLFSLAQEKRIDFDLQFLDSIENIQTDEQIFKTLVRNLVHNAIKFSPAGSVVTLKVKSVGQRIQIEVQDCGPGIPEEHRVSVFEPFTRLVQSEVEGSGLGLAIVKECVDQLNGQISLHDREDGESGLLALARL